MKLLNFEGMREGDMYPDAVLSGGSIRDMARLVLERFVMLQVPLPWRMREPYWNGLNEQEMEGRARLYLFAAWPAGRLRKTQRGVLPWLRSILPWRAFVRYGVSFYSFRLINKGQSNERLLDDAAPR